jgi:lipid-binding SYLF domain-containing protein
VNITENILLVDWGKLSNERNYFESAMYSQKVGRYLGDFLIILRNSRLLKTFHQIHMIGLGLGAHVAAAAAQYLKERAGGHPIIGRITGE